MDFSKCSSYVSTQVQYTYSGNQYTVELTDLPAFDHVQPIYFNQNAPRQDASVKALGTPAPAISLAPGSVRPAGVDFAGSDILGDGKAEFTFRGFGSGTAGTYPVTLQAQNANGTTTQTFQITIAPQLRITSPASLVVPYGQPVSFLVTTTGWPAPALSIDPKLLAPFPGLSFHDNGNGTATISGSTISGIGITTSGACQTINGKTACTGITATSPQGTVTQPFGLGVPYPPEAKLVVSSATFVAGVPNSFKVTTTGTTTPILFALDLAGLSWLSFHDYDNGTGELSGTPPVDTSGAYTLQVYPYPNVYGGVISALPLPFTLNVLGKPQFISHNSASFTEGDPSSFTIATNQPSGSITEIGALPQGLEFTDNGNGTATISGTPAADTGGYVTLQLSISSGTRTGTQALNLQVNQAPALAIPPLPNTNVIFANFYAGQQNSFAIPVSGYPLLSSAPVSQSQTAANYVPGMEFTVTGLPTDLSYTNLNPAGFNTGTLTLSGKPAASDVGGHLVIIAATNGVGADAAQQLILNVEPVPGDVNGDGVANCADFDLVKASFGRYRNQPGYNPVADINNDGVVNIDDLAIVAKNLLKGAACH